VAGRLGDPAADQAFGLHAVEHADHREQGHVVRPWVRREDREQTCERTTAKKTGDTALRVLAGALAEQRANVLAVPVHLHIGRVGVGVQASRRRSAARGLTPGSCRQRWSCGWLAALVTLSSGRRVKCRVWI
jgi:hypothetical protein